MLPLERRSGARHVSSRLALLLLLAAAPGVGAEQSRPPDAPASAAAAPPPVEAELAPYLLLSQPGAEHHALDPLVGSFDLELRWQSTGGEFRASGVAQNRWILDGRFLLCEFSAGEGPARITAASIYGFDNRQKRYVALHMHNLATFHAQLAGSYDLATRSFLLSGKQRDEATGYVLTSRELLKIEGPDRHQVAVYFDVPGRAPVKALEAVFTRR